jgi:hypothetical protein
MNTIFRNLSCAATLGAMILGSSAFAQTAGSVSITAKLADTGSGPEHWTVVWVTNATTGAFVRTIRRQGESYSSHWNDHCPAWYTAVNNNASRYTVAADGFTGATASTYAAPNSPFTQTWNCKDASGATVPDGTYKIWIQYAEDTSGAGPVTTGGMVWTKGPTASTVNPPNQGTNFTNMSIVWTPGATTVTAPDIAVEQPVGSNLVDGSGKKSFGTVKLGKKVTKAFTIKNTGTANLTGLAVVKKGTHAKDFVTTAPVAKVLAPGASTTFKVTFKPLAKGTRNAVVQIKSNDPNENPFDIKVTGAGK